MEGRLNDFEKTNNSERLNGLENEALIEIENRYRTAEGIANTLMDQVKEDFENLYDMYENLSPEEQLTKEHIQRLIAKMKDIYPDVIASGRNSSLEDDFFPKKNMEEEVEEDNENIN